MVNMYCSVVQTARTISPHPANAPINNDLFSNGEKTNQRKYKTKIRLSSESSKRTIRQNARDDGVSRSSKRTGIIRRNNKKNYVGKEKKDTSVKFEQQKKDFMRIFAAFFRKGRIVRTFRKTWDPRR